MHVERTKYTAHYENGFVVAQWISVEMAIDDSNAENAISALDRSKELVEQWYKANNATLENTSMPPGSPPIIEVRPEDRVIGVTVEDIKSCQDLTTLDSYRIIIRGKTELELAYVQRRPQLVEKENNKLITASKKFDEDLRKKTYVR